MDRIHCIMDYPLPLVGLSLGPVWRPLALVEASTKVAGKLNCLFSPVEKESGMSI